MPSLSDRMVELKVWYRAAMQRRVQTLDGILEQIPSEVRAESEDGPRPRTLERGDEDQSSTPGDPEQRLRGISHALRGSGGSYGFPLVTEVARLVEDGPDDLLLPRAVGLTDVLREVAEGVEDDPERSCHGWLAHAVGPLAEGISRTLEPRTGGPAAAWTAIQHALDLEDTEVARLIARRLGVEPTPREPPQPAALRLVPPGLARDTRTVPLREDGIRLWAASANPTDVKAVLELQRISGRVVSLTVATPSWIADTLDDLFVEDVGENTEAWDGISGFSLTEGEGRVPTVLLVDDDRSFLRLVGAVLRQEGFQVEEAGNSERALEILEEGGGSGTIDLMAVDLELPGMGGAELVRTVREGEGTSRLPIVVLAGASSQDSEIDLLEAGADDYLRKPLEPRLFLARVRATLRRRDPRG